jgi:uncharacterized protein YbaR (Trm112 family)
LPSSATPFGFLDSPSNNQTVGDSLPFQGWVLAEDPAEVRIEIQVDHKPMPVPILDRVQRPDVLRVHHSYEALNPTPGFHGVFGTFLLANGRHHFQCLARTADHTVMLGECEIEVLNGPYARFYEGCHLLPDPPRRQRKLTHLLTILWCPHCKSSLEQRDVRELICNSCGQAFPLQGGVPIMIAGNPEHPVDPAKLSSPPSNNPYPASVLDQLERLSRERGWALDLGSGRRSFGADPVIQLEICTYPFTDVVNQGDYLPFRDESFDFVFCLAVTEHVRRPWILASEIERVLKTGATVIVDSAFLQALHGYPHHYFNMTHFGLRSIFPGLEVSLLEPAPYQHSWFALRHLLSLVHVDLAADDKAELEGMTVRQFLIELNHFCDQGTGALKDITIPEERVWETAAGFTLHGRKRGGADTASSPPRA